MHKRKNVVNLRAQYIVICKIPIEFTSSRVQCCAFKASAYLLQPKANYAERALKTIKGRLMRYFSHKRTARWVDVLPQITESYNNTWHRTIKRKPSSVTIENAERTSSKSEIMLGFLISDIHSRVNIQLGE